MKIRKAVHRKAWKKQLGRMLMFSLPEASLRLQTEALNIVDAPYDSIQSPGCLSLLLEFLLLRSLVGARPLHLKEVGAADVHHDDVGQALGRVFRKGAECAARLVEHRYVLGSEKEVATQGQVVADRSLYVSFSVRHRID